jgi:glycosyltransferase involved in cell wall biosynthesis
VATNPVQHSTKKADSSHPDSAAIPRVSICIPTYNRAQLMRRTLESALEQSGSDVEIVVLDDGSTDGTFAVASGYRDARLRIERTAQRLGAGQNFNRCLDAARGVYVKILCDDDVLYPTAVARLADALDRFPDATLATSAWHLLDAAGSVTRTFGVLRRAPEQGALVDLRRIVKDSWLYLNRIGSPSSVLLRKTALTGLRFNPEYRQMMDWDLWLRLLKRGPLVYLPQILSAYQFHTQTLSVSHEPLAQTARDLLAVSHDLRESMGEYRGAVSRWDVKRLQLLCVASASRVALRNVRRGAWRRAAGNARLALRALSTFLTKW